MSRELTNGGFVFQTELKLGGVLVLAGTSNISVRGQYVSNSAAPPARTKSAAQIPQAGTPRTREAASLRDLNGDYIRFCNRVVAICSETQFQGDPNDRRSGEMKSPGGG